MGLVLDPCCFDSDQNIISDLNDDCSSEGWSVHWAAFIHDWCKCWTNEGCWTEWSLSSIQKLVLVTVASRKCSNRRSLSSTKIKVKRPYEKVEKNSNDEIELLFWRKCKVKGEINWSASLRQSYFTSQKEMT